MRWSSNLNNNMWMSCCRKSEKYFPESDPTFFFKFPMHYSHPEVVFGLPVRLRHFRDHTAPGVKGDIVSRVVRPNRNRVVYRFDPLDWDVFQSL